MEGGADIWRTGINGGRKSRRCGGAESVHWEETALKRSEGRGQYRGLDFRERREDQGSLGMQPEPRVALGKVATKAALGLLSFSH